MRVSVIQMNQGSEKQANLDQARRLVEAAVEADRPGMVTLPETWTNLGGGRDSRQAAAELLPRPAPARPAARPMSCCAAWRGRMASMSMAAR